MNQSILRLQVKVSEFPKVNRTLWFSGGGEFFHPKLLRKRPRHHQIEHLLHQSDEFVEELIFPEDKFLIVYTIVNIHEFTWDKPPAIPSSVHPRMSKT